MGTKKDQVTEFDKQLGMSISKERKKLKKDSDTQQAVANAVGVTLQTYQHWEAGTRKIKAEHLLALAKHFEVSVDYLLGNAPARSTNPDVQIAMEYTGLSEDVVTQLHSIVTDPKQAQKIWYLNAFYEDLNANDFASALEKLHCACYAAHLQKLVEGATFLTYLQHRKEYTDAEIRAINANKLIETAKFYEDNTMLSEILLFIAKNLQLDEKSALFSSAVLMPEDIFKNDLQKLFTFAVEEYCARGHITSPSDNDLESLGLNKTTYYVPSSKWLSSLFHYPQNETEEPNG